MKNVLVDTNILQYGVNDGYANDVADLFLRLKTASYDLAVSAYTTFEIYKDLSAKRVPVTKSLVDTFTPLEVDLATFKIAATLATCYKTHEATKGYHERYSSGDTIIAASAFRYGSFVLTANGNDFPRPFFAEVAQYTIKSTKNNAPILIQALSPDGITFQQAITAYFPKK